MPRGDGACADRRPDAAHHQLQAEPVFVGGESFDGNTQMGLRLFGDDVGEFFRRPPARLRSRPSDCAAAASGSTIPAPSALPSRATRQAFPAPIRRPSRWRPCRSSTARRQAAVRSTARQAAPEAPASELSPDGVVAFKTLLNPTLSKRSDLACLAR